MYNPYAIVSIIPAMQKLGLNSSIKLMILW